MKHLILLSIAMLTGMESFEQRVTLSLNNAPFRTLIQEIEQQSSYVFIYTAEQLTQITPVTVQEHNIAIFPLLDQLLQQSGIGYMVKEHQIILISRYKSFSFAGRILSATGQPLEGITVESDDGSTAVTNNDGTFYLRSKRPSVTLIISGAEIESLVLKFEAGYRNIQVKQLIRELDETIVLGYGSTTRRFNAGNVYQVRMKDLAELSGGNMLPALQGRVPGLLITASGGAPASSYTVQVRGQQSLNPNPLINYRIPPVDQPLVIINGVPFAPQNNPVSQLSSPASPGSLEIYQNPYGGISPFSLIDPADIESIEVLKDASTTSIYGSRAANGIILITTRRSAGEQFSGEIRVTTGVNFIRQRPEMLSTDAYLRLRRDALMADSITADLLPGSPGYAPDLLRFDEHRYTNWSRYFFQSAALFSGLHAGFAGKAGRFQLSGRWGIRKEDNLLKGDFYTKQVSLLNEVSYRSLNNKLLLRTSVYFLNGTNRSVGSALILKAISLPPNYPELYDGEGRLNWNYGGIELNDNPAALLRQSYSIRSSNLLANADLQYHFNKQWWITVNAGFNRVASTETTLIPQASLPPADQSNARAWYGATHFDTRLVEPQLNYRLDKGKWSLNILSGFTLQQNGLMLESKKASAFDSNTVLIPTNAGRIDTRSIDDAYRYSSLFSRISFRYAGRYLFHLSGRQEHSSRFATNNQSGMFAAMGAGWIFSEERFFKKHISFLDFGKLRWSYGSSGNDHIGYYHYLDAWTRAGRYTGNQALPGGIRDGAFSWSVTKKLDVGIELRLFNDHVDLDVSYYDQRCTDQLISQFTASSPGRSRYIANFPAVVQNSGWELCAGWRGDQAKPWRWRMQVVVTVPSNKLRSFPGLESSLYANNYWIGQPLNASKVIHYSGVDAATGLFTFIPDQASFFSIDPRMYGGLSGRLQYRQWEAQLFLECRLQTGINYLRQIYDQPPGFMVNQPEEVMDYWRSQGNSAVFQRPGVDETSAARYAAFLLTVSDEIYDNASFLRLQNFQLSYTIPVKNLKRSHLAEIRTFMQLQNILTLTSFPVTDPEVQSFFSYPQTKNITIGLAVRL